MNVNACSVFPDFFVHFIDYYPFIPQGVDFLFAGFFFRFTTVILKYSCPFVSLLCFCCGWQTRFILAPGYTFGLIAISFPAPSPSNRGFSLHKKDLERRCPLKAVILELRDFFIVGCGYTLFQKMNQYSFAPAGIRSSTIKRLRPSLPFSSCTAEISIPSESMSIILRGGRFTMAIAVFPTKSSGS